MRTRVKVQVKQSHINKGERENPYKCPIALRLKEMGYKNPCVDTGRITVAKGTCAVTTEKAVCFINRFDKKLSVKPTSFELIFETLD